MSARSARAIFAYGAEWFVMSPIVSGVTWFGDGSIMVADGGPLRETGGTPTVPMNPSRGEPPPTFLNHPGLELAPDNAVGGPARLLPSCDPDRPIPAIGCEPTLDMFRVRVGAPACAITLFMSGGNKRMCLSREIEEKKKD